MKVVETRKEIHPIDLMEFQLFVEDFDVDEHSRNNFKTSSSLTGSHVF